jgi:hypothetical protein
LHLGFGPSFGFHTRHLRIAHRHFRTPPLPAYREETEEAEEEQQQECDTADDCYDA